MNLPKSYNELSVRQFQEATSIIQKEKDVLERHIKLIACFTGKSVEWVESHTPVQIAEWARSMDFLSKPILDKRIAKYVLVNKRIYKPVADASKLSAGQVIALKYYEDKSNGTHSHLHEQLACLFVDVDLLARPKKYDALKHERIAKDMLDLKIGDCYGTLFFYTNVLEKLKPVMEIYLKQATETIEEILPEVMEWAKEQGLKVS